MEGEQLCSPGFFPQHPLVMQPASKLLWKALLHKEKCAEADGALGQSQSAASAAAWAEGLTPSPARLARAGFLVLVSALLGCHPDLYPGPG